MLVRSTVAAVIASPTAAADELHVSCLDVERIACIAVLIGPFLHFQAALDIYGRAFCQVFRCILSLLAPERDAKPCGCILHLTGFILAAFVGCDRKTADRNSLRRVAELGVAAEISDDSYLVKGHLGDLSQRVIYVHSSKLVGILHASVCNGQAGCVRIRFSDVFRSRVVFFNLMPVTDFAVRLSRVSWLFLAILALSLPGLAFDSPLAVRQCWQYPTTELNERGLAADNSAVYLSERGGRLEAISLYSGRRLWFSDLGGEIISNVIIDDSAVFLATRSEGTGGSHRSFLRSLSKITGITNWVADMPDAGTAFLGSSKKDLVIAADSGFVSAVQPQSGTLHWTAELNSKISVAPDFSDTEMLIADAGRDVIVISLDTGAVRSKSTLPYAPTALLMLDNGHAAVGDERGNVVYFNTGSQKAVWKIKNGGAISDILNLGDTLLVASNDNFAYSIATYNGGIRWKRRQPDRIFKPGLLSDELVVLSPRSGGATTVLDKDHGKAVDSIAINFGDLIQSPLASAERVLFPMASGIFAYSLDGCKAN